MDPKVVRRLIYGSAMIVLLSLVLWVDIKLSERGRFSWASGAIVSTLCILTVLELSRLLKACGMEDPTGSCAWLPAAFILGKLWIIGAAVQPMKPWCATWTAMALLSAVVTSLLPRNIHGGARRAAAVFLCLGLAVLLSALLEVLAEFGPRIAFALVFTIKAGDIGAYLTGRFLGRRRLIPHISPGKTVEGTVGGFALSAVAGLWLFSSFSEGAWSKGSILGMAVLLNLAGMLGDLIESLLKRDAGAKDSGTVLREFGGAYDMVDSLVLAAPLGLALLRLLGATSGA